jgi:hypothetical protein
MRAYRLALALACLGLIQPLAGAAQAAPAAGPLRVHPVNPRYFTDDGVRALYLTGSHTWASLQDEGPTDPPARLDYPAYLDFLEAHGHNFTRLWVLEHARWTVESTGDWHVAPLPYLRTGPGLGRDGKPRFDLTRWDPAFFDRLRSRVQTAAARGIYVSVMLFQGWGIHRKPNHPGNPWPGHPFHRENNVNGVDGDPDGDGEGAETHSLAIPEVLRVQEAYVRKVVETLHDLPNLLYEVANESPATPEGIRWQHHMVRRVRDYSAERGTRHPVVMSWPWPPAGGNRLLFDGPADAVAPGWGGHWGARTDDYRTDPPPADGRKVVLADSDHFWGVGGDAAWVWKSFLRGTNPIYMDPYPEGGGHARPAADPSARRAMGDTLRYARRLGLDRLRPARDLASSGFALANPGVEYLAYLPGRTPAGWRTRLRRWGGPLLEERPSLRLALPDVPRTFEIEWFDPWSGQALRAARRSAAGPTDFEPPFPGDAVLHLRATRDASAHTR